MATTHSRIIARLLYIEADSKHLMEVCPLHGANDSQVSPTLLIRRLLVGASFLIISGLQQLWYYVMVHVLAVSCLTTKCIAFWLSSHHFRKAVKSSQWINFCLNKWYNDKISWKCFIPIVSYCFSNCSNSCRPVTVKTLSIVVRCFVNKSADSLCLQSSLHSIPEYTSERKSEWALNFIGLWMFLVYVQ